MARILVVEPEPTQRASCGRELESEGHHVEGARDATDALRRLRAAPPDLVVSEVALPGIDGLDLLMRIRERHPRLPVVLHCASDWYRERYVSWAADAYVTKGPNLAELRSVIRTLLSGQQA
jgi:DNA-binding response OmpR family regulator